MKYCWCKVTNDEDRQSIKISGYKGTWTAIERVDTKEATYYLFEKDINTNLTYNLVVVYLDEQPIEIYETYDDIITFLTMEGLIE